MAKRPAAKKTGVVARPFAASKLEAQFLFQCRAVGLDLPAREVKFHPDRKWRIDFSWVHPKNSVRLIGLEIDGGVFSGGRHTRGTGFTADCEKLNEANLLGWTIFRATAAHVKNGMAIDWIARALK